MEGGTFIVLYCTKGLRKEHAARYVVLEEDNEEGRCNSNQLGVRYVSVSRLQMNKATGFTDGVHVILGFVS